MLFRYFKEKLECLGIFNRFLGVVLAIFIAFPVNAATTILPPGETCFVGLSGITGMVGLLGAITGGSGGISGTYGGVALTGGSGSGATANITVSGGIVTAVAILNPGVQYIVSDVLSAAAANIGNVTGFSVPVSSVSLNSSLAGGSVSFYIPNTQTFKQTWQNSGQTILNQNPTPLDANGCLIAYGTGIYREVVKDSLGNTVFDQLTTDTSAFNSVFWAGQATGTPNVITVIDVGFNGTAGSVINFLARSTNTGPATLNPSGFGAIPILKDTATGPVALTGGEIAITNSGSENVISVVYDATGNAFHILNLIASAATSNQAPLCGAINLKIVNDTTFPNTQFDITADQVVMITAQGQYITRNNVSANVNFTVGASPPSMPNGLDGEALTQATWYNIYLIDNGIVTSGLGSLSATAPNLPSGYSYKCRIGAVRTDVSTTNLLRTLQRGNRTQYMLVAGSDTTIYPAIATGSTSGTMTIESVSALVPPTANVIKYILYTVTANATALGPNVVNTPGTTATAFSGVNGTSITNGSTFSIPGEFLLESTNVYYSGSATSSAAYTTGWQDSVNAN